MLPQPPRVLRKSLLAGAREAEGVAVVIDVLRGDREHFPPSDPIYCLQRDLFDFVAVAALEGEDLVARRMDIPEKEIT